MRSSSKIPVTSQAEFSEDETASETGVLHRQWGKGFKSRVTPCKAEERLSKEKLNSIERPKDTAHLEYFCFYHPFCEEIRSESSTGKRCICKGRKLKTQCITSPSHTRTSPTCPLTSQTQKHKSVCAWYFETQEPGSKMDNAGKWHLAWSTTPAAAPENLPHAHVHQSKSIGVPRTPQPHPGVHIDTHTLPKSSPLFPALALKTRRPPAERSEPAGFTPRSPGLRRTSSCCRSRLGAQGLVWGKYLPALGAGTQCTGLPGQAVLHIYSRIANNMESKEERKPDKIKVCHQV